MKSWSESWPPSTSHPSRSPVFTPEPCDSSPLFGDFLSPTHTWQPSTWLFKGNRDSWNVIPARCPRDSCSQWKKISPWYLAWLAASAEEGGKFARDLVALALLPHLLSLLPKGGSCLSSEHDIPCPRVKRSDCTPRCFTIKSCLEKPQRRPQHKQDTYSWQTAAMKKPEWNHSDSC